ncbi:hypothetical protein [uncultured Methanobrevibacter sp.]|uniref:hypothetical protein n=1 Tax=uncultured Methanobrevibacter sp. TaxID=253161 RepID=UPI0026136669|nr:hypothetical protein [uncultured Methanobrevibacter sp.]
MTTYTKKGDKLKGNKIKCEARKISNPRPVNKSGRHKTQQIDLRDHAECIIEKESKYIAKKNK